MFMYTINNNVINTKRLIVVIDTISSVINTCGGYNTTAFMILVDNLKTMKQSLFSDVINKTNKTIIDISRDENLCFTLIENNVYYHVINDSMGMCIKINNDEYEIKFNSIPESEEISSTFLKNVIKYL